MPQIRVYLDTSVFGGVNNDEFPEAGVRESEWSRPAWDRARRKGTSTSV